MIRRPEEDEFAAIDAHIRGLRSDAIRAIASQINIQDTLERILQGSRDLPTRTSPEDVRQGLKGEGIQ
jgi:hypothetical protein